MIEDTTRPNQSPTNSPHIPEPSECLHVRMTSVPSRSVANLSSMPVEIKEMIVHWVDCMCDKSTGYESDDIQSLALVDRGFSQLCCPALFRGYELSDQPVKGLIRGLPIIQKHSKHLRSLGWRVSYEELLSKNTSIEGRPDIWNADTRVQWDSETRSELILLMLQACHRLKNLDIDLDPFENITEDPRPDKKVAMWCYDDNMSNKFIPPISQLSSLVSLALTSPRDRPCFSETFLVKIISNLPQLQTFSCAGIRASAPGTFEEQEPYQSPLGLQLASLPHLKHLILDFAQCFDGSWTRPVWRGPVELLSLTDCPQASIGVLHAFTKLFASTLLDFVLDTAASHDDESWNDDPIAQALCSGKLSFELPKLQFLKASYCLPMRLLRAFEASENLSRIDLCETPMLQQSDVTALIQLWPNLKEIYVWHSEAFESESVVDRLMHLAAERGIKMQLQRILDEP